jgi:hypothetical protein
MKVELWPLLAFCAIGFASLDKDFISPGRNFGRKPAVAVTGSEERPPGEGHLPKDDSAEAGQPGPDIMSGEPLAPASMAVRIR